jgi:Smg protein
MIIKQSVVDVLMFLFERYLGDEEHTETARVTDDRDDIQRRLKEMGFHNSEINQAFDWLEDLADMQVNAEIPAISATSSRIYSEQEKKLIGTESIGFLSFLEQTGILTPGTRELILDRVIALGQPLDTEQLKWIIMIVLHTHPDVETTIELMEGFIFDESVDLLQ